MGWLYETLMRLVGRRSSLRLAPCSALAVASSACITPILNTPHVEQGTQVTGAATLSSGVVFDPADSVKRLQVPGPAFSVRGSFGFRPPDSSWRPALALGVQGSLFNGLMADAYLQAPQRLTGATDLGAGVAGVGFSYTGWGSYLQAGRRVNENTYLFTTQSVWSVRTIDKSGRRLWWQPTIAMQRPRPPGERTQFVFVTMTVGPSFSRCQNVLVGCLSASPEALVAIGVSVSTPAYPFR